jgi:hypothetical protein
MMKRGIGMAIAVLLAASAQAEVSVKFIDPAKFSDIKDNTGFPHQEILKDIEAHLVEQAGRRLVGQDLSIEVTDVDLAGDVQPIGRRMDLLRVMRPVTSPAIELRYELREGGKVVRTGTAKLRDMSYQDSINTYPSGDPLRYERRMLDRWLDQEFGRVKSAGAK